MLIYSADAEGSNSPKTAPFKVPLHGIFWLRDDALEDGANLPAPGIIAPVIVADLEAALEQFQEIEEDLKN